MYGKELEQQAYGYGLCTVLYVLFVFPNFDSEGVRTAMVKKQYTV